MTVRMRVLVAVATAAFCTAVMAFALSGGASAAVLHEPLGSFGPAGSGAQGFGNVQSIAVDESTGTVYVYEAGSGSIEKFDRKGEPAEFSALKANTIPNVGGVGGETQIAVDSSSGPAKGDIYIANTATVAIYGSDGKYLGELNGAGHPGGENCGVAVDASGDVYVGLYGEHVNKYTPTSNVVTNADYVSTLYTHDEMCYVAADPFGNVYTVPWGGGQVKKYSVATEFNTLGVGALGTVTDGGGSSIAADRVNGDLYVDNGSQVAQYDSTGKQLGVTVGFENSNGVGVDGATGEVFVSNGTTGRVEIFGPPVIAPDVTTEAASETQPTHETLSGTVNPDGVQVTACQFEYGATTSYGQTGPCEQQPGSGTSPVAVTAKLTGIKESTTYHFRLKAANAKVQNFSEDKTFTTHGSPGVKIMPATNVTLTAASLHAEVNPYGFDTTYRFEYGTDTTYGTSVPVPDEDLGSDTAYLPVSVALSGLEQNTTYHFRIVASSSHGDTVGEDQTFTTEPAVRIERESAPEVQFETVKLEADIAPRGLDTTYHFQYGTETTYGTNIPVPDPTISGTNGDKAIAVNVSLNGLASDTTYHYRVIATNTHGTDTGPDRTFTTLHQASVSTADSCPNAAYRIGPAAQLPDCRAYEMVSPLDKGGSFVGANGRKGARAGVDGEEAYFIMYAGVGDVAGSGGVGLTDYVASRGSSGWQTRSITPGSSTTPRALIDGGTFPVGAFSSDLSHAIFFGYQLPGVDPGTGVQNLYRLDTFTRGLETITLKNNPDPINCYKCLDLATLGEEGGSIIGYSSNLGVVAFESQVNLTPDASGTVPKLYEWDHGVLRLGGILPNGTVPVGGAVGPAATSSVSKLAAAPHAVSSDGSRVLFASPGPAPKQLYMRVKGESTIWLSRSWISNASPEHVYFQASSADDRKVLFSTRSRLLESDPGNGEVALYMYAYSENEPESEGKLEFVARVNAPRGEEEGIVAGMSEDGTHVYFYTGSSTPVLPKRGEYLWDKGSIHFVAGVTEPISWLSTSGGGNPEALGRGWLARVSADWRRLAFQWVADRATEPELASPAPNEDTGVAGIAGTFELVRGGHVGVSDTVSYRAMYLYDEASEKLDCVSCPSNGSPMKASVEIEANVVAHDLNAGQGVFLPRFFSSDGKRLFFTSHDALVQQDTNGLADVYEYIVDTKEVKLLSSGTGDSGAWFEDASEDGNDAFFLTAEKLLREDTDTLIDLYDARVSGGFSEPLQPPPPCDGDACQGIPSSIPSFSTASGFTGLGNGHGVAVTQKRKQKKAKPKRRKRGKHATGGHAKRVGGRGAHRSSRVGR